MGELQTIHSALRRTASRRRMERALHGLWIGLLTGTATWLLLLSAYKLAPLPQTWVDWAWVAPLTAGLLGFLAAGWRRVPLPAAARLLEARRNLDQRLSTALELAEAPQQPHPEWTRLVVADAARAVQQVELSRLLPLRLPMFARWIPVLLAVVVGLGWVPEYRSAAHLQQRRDAQIIRETGRKLAELVRHELVQHPPEREAIRDALREAGNLGDRLAQAKLTKAEALQDLVNAAERLKEEARQLDSQPVLQKLQQAARTASTPSGAGSQTAQRKQLDKLQKSPGNTPDALEKLAQQLQQAQKIAAGMQGNAPDAAAQQQLAQALSQLAQNAGQMGLDLGGLNRALDALQQLDAERLLKDLKEAGRDLDKLRDLAKQLAEAQKTAEQLGKDLAEQLARGQAETAAETLERMVEQLKSAGLSAEQTRKLMEEVARSLKPAEGYGKVAELLKAGAEQLKAGAKPGAAENLAKAATELRELAKQAGEAQQLAEALESLQSAQLAIASGRGWPGGQCKGGACTGCSLHPSGKINWGKGGKPGRGVGTWADENGWLFYPEITERWDNSGVNRPDMAGRGHTDRGDGRLSENVLPTKLQGQFSPGAMPSIPLKGVSIVGQSTVPFQQAIDAAQSEAQSALNQDQVPRAYRGAVKGYFDDLK